MEIVPQVPNINNINEDHSYDYTNYIVTVVLINMNINLCLYDDINTMNFEYSTMEYLLTFNKSTIFDIAWWKFKTLRKKRKFLIESTG